MGGTARAAVSGRAGRTSFNLGSASGDDASQKSSRLFERQLVQTYVFGMRESTALVSGRSRASPHERRSIAATKGDATDRPPGRRPLAPPEIASGNARNTSRQIFHPAEIAIGPAFLERSLRHGGSPRRVSGCRWVEVGTQSAMTRRVTSPVARPIVPSHAPGEHKCPQAQCA